MRRLLFLPLLLAALLLAGCATDKRNQSLTATLNAYANTLRWGDFQTAEQFVDPEVREKHPVSALDRARYQQLKVSDYNDDAGPVPDGENQVRQTVQINLVNIHTQTERSVIDHQIWRYDPAKNRWWLTSGLPDVSQQ
ncbi:hypothetical protein [Fulvimonas soli]|jgi:hypothetical protein|uniref:Lipoprotein n=1 Tax=Fulvimonas soli TaxID=155197 RepID=A0A316I2V0_9GAMM|nr:hypothetical protein [Fulvimonas soli]PWK86686.1 hypothetical protein C7456_10777 [Fulvimonas soli]TNY25973.1 hypothetical protein BV497_11135 [Fulvimonas soli]